MLGKMTIKQIDDKIAEIESLTKKLNLNNDEKVNKAIKSLNNLKTDKLLESTIEYNHAMKDINDLFVVFDEDYLVDPEEEISEENLLTSPASFTLFKKILKSKEILVANFEEANIKYEKEAYEKYQAILQKVSVYNQYFKSWIKEEEAKRKADENKLKCLLDEILL